MQHVHVSISGGTILEIPDYPDNCPYCHLSIKPIILFGFTKNLFAKELEVFMKCPNQTCNRGFIAYYNTLKDRKGFKFDGNTSQGTLAKRNFNNVVVNVSASFVSIYNQAYAAEQQDLLEICGVGFRKSLEFLIKDYIIQSRPDQEDAIKKKMLGRCIDEYINDSRIKSVAKRATWLGNDETHYVKKWETKSLADLKKLIELTVHWIEMEALTQSFEEDMPE